ncbi:MAG: cysteine synthase A [Rickettsiales bacterium]|mgnify:CR=1 FL=1|nr:cysteine synthase A [Rickettsiales bacterium]OUV78983.1 MAG: cysteine synthase A [Rickettsiales bacterium TMED131]|tara:strand:+ start:421 stop:1392 length:972 start_codon:yes stop_codon:yes gene_type:complete
MEKVDNIVNLVGNTPLIRLKKASEMTGCNILGKAEFLNPGQSIKDRAALNMIMESKSDKKLIVEGTGGNTGIGLTVIGNALGYKTKIVMPDNQSEEKIKLLKYLGAEVILTKQLPFTDPRNYIQLAKQIAINENAIWTNQFDNIANREAHIKTTSQEIWKQTDGKIDAFICSVGTGGTLAGNYIGLKEKNKNIKVFCADPYGSGMYSWIKKGIPKSSHSSITEGIGQSRITKNLAGIKFDGAFKVHDKIALKIIYDLIKTEGLFLGPTSGINIGGAIKLAKKVGPNKTIVTILCDSAERYTSKIFNKRFLVEKGFDINTLNMN